MQENRASVCAAFVTNGDKTLQNKIRSLFLRLIRSPKVRALFLNFSMSIPCRAQKRSQRQRRRVTAC